MKKFCVSLTALAVVSVIMLLSFSHDNASQVFFEANVEALATSESVETKQCYNETYDVTQANEFAIFCDKNTSISKIYTCPQESFARKGSSDRCLK